MDAGKLRAETDGCARFELFDINTAPLDIGSDFAPTLSLQGDCQASIPGKVAIPDDTSSGTYENKWANSCTIAVTKAGTYHLRVKSSSIVNINGTSVGDSGNGWNQFSLKASVSGTGVTPSLYGVGDLSLFNNLPGLTGNITATFYFRQDCRGVRGQDTQRAAAGRIENRRRPVSHPNAQLVGQLAQRPNCLECRTQRQSDPLVQ